MIELKNKFAIGCLVQWYEIELIGEYLQSLKNALSMVRNKENIIVDLYFNMTTSLEKIDENQCTMHDIHKRFNKIEEDLSGLDIILNIQRLGGIMLCDREKIYTIADYRREFNEKYCDKVDVLMWGESDSLIPKQTFEILDNLHNGVKKTTPKYLGFFATCKMWDDSWKVLEHPDFTDKPFIGGDEKNWWSLRYDMNIDEMNEINDRTDELDVSVVSPHKFNGCGLVISSEVIRSGVNIPKTVFFVHEDTAFMYMTNKVLGNIPQYLIKNVLLVHNRKHKNKRKYILGENHLSDKDPGGKRLTHDWYMRANKMCEENYLNLFNPNYKAYTWADVFDE